MKGFGKALQKPNSNCIFLRVVAMGISFLLWDIPVSLHDHHVWVDTHQVQLASGIGLAGRHSEALVQLLEDSNSVSAQCDNVTGDLGKHKCLLHGAIQTSVISSSQKTLTLNIR
ncbi:hypothetical protein VULLAG_LOCUS12265 [Vulpes lagopus]